MHILLNTFFFDQPTWCEQPHIIIFIDYLFTTDERALVDGARKFGYIFDTRTPNSVEILAVNKREKYEVLNVIEFTSTRKRMSIIVKTPEGKIKIFCKGADSVIYERLSTELTSGESEQTADDLKEITLRHLELFAVEGLRTLCFASAEITDNQYKVDFPLPF